MPQAIKYNTFIQPQENIRRSWEWFVEAFMGKRFVQKMIKQSKERIYKEGVLYADQALYRDGFVNMLDIKACNRLKEFDKRYSDPVYEYLKVGDFLFKFTKHDGAKQHVYYSLTTDFKPTAYQLELFN